MRKRRRVTNRQLMSELSELRTMLYEIKGKLAPKRFMSFAESLPPRDVLLRANAALNITHNYGGFSEVMTSYYQIEGLPYTVSPENVPAGAIACYSRTLHRVYSKEKVINNHTALHELFHALVTKNVVYVPSEKEQEYADKYAEACQNILRGT